MDNILDPLRGLGDSNPAGVSRSAVVTGRAFEDTTYVEWPAIFAGTVVALAVGFVLLTFGSAMGLSAVSPWTSTRATVMAVSWGAVFWMILANVWSFGLGGYLAARMRHRRVGAAVTEVAFRDGAHGAVVWALSVTIGAIVAALVAASIAHSGLNLAAASANDPVTTGVDSLLRSSQPASREELTRVLASSVGRTGLAIPDRTYLAQIVAARAGIPQADAERRVDQIVVQTKEAANRARKTAIVIGFLTAATLLLGAASAWCGATMGGKHRDEGNIWAGLAGRVDRQSIWQK